MDSSSRRLAPSVIQSLAAVAVCTLVAAAPAHGAALGRYHIDASQVSVSGVSSGGAMATQLHVAYSSVFKKGVGVVAAPPYYCAEGTITNAISRCMDPTSAVKPRTSSLIGYTNSWSGYSIDSTSNLANTRVYIFSGTLDSKVKQPAVNETYNYYRNYVPAANVFYKNNIAAEHSFVSDSYGNACSDFATPYINNCNFDLAGELLKWIHGGLNARTGAVAGNFIQFDQNEFRPLATRDRDGFDTSGWVYVPTNCQNGATCKLHVALHGCAQGQSFVGDKFYRHAGYNEWAEANNMIVLYPQAVASGTSGTFSTNPNGCWDWWGYSGSSFYDYARKAGVQPAAIKKMIDRLKGAI